MIHTAEITTTSNDQKQTTRKRWGTFTNLSFFPFSFGQRCLVLFCFPRLFSGSCAHYHPASSTLQRQFSFPSGANRTAWASPCHCTATVAQRYSTTAYMLLAHFTLPHKKSVNGHTQYHCIFMTVRKATFSVFWNSSMLMAFSDVFPQLLAPAVLVGSHFVKLFTMMAAYSKRWWMSGIK